MLWYVLIVKVILVILIQKTKQKQKKTKKDPYFGMGKNTKVMPQNAPLSIFSLGKGREYLRLKPYIKLITSALPDLPPACNDLDKASMTHLKIAQNMYIFSREFYTFPVTEGNEIQHSFQIMTPTRKLTQDTNFGHSKIIHHFGPENPQNPTQKDTTFE